MSHEFFQGHGRDGGPLLLSLGSFTRRLSLLVLRPNHHIYSGEKFVILFYLFDTHHSFTFKTKFK
jgi:hypothetical protein